MKRHILLTDEEIALLEFFANAKHNKDLQSIVDRATAPMTPHERMAVSLARNLYEKDGEIEFDDAPIISPSDEGAYVMAWVWAPVTDWVRKHSENEDSSDED